MYIENYTSVCEYCCIIYRCNRSTSRFCCGKHRSLYGKHGPAINPFVLDRNGKWINADDRLKEITFDFDHNGDSGRHYFYWLENRKDEYGYEGPLPKGDEIIIVGSFAVRALSICMSDKGWLYSFKHISKLTIEERTKCHIVRGEL